MKIPYIKIPIADVSAYLAPYSFDIKGKIFQAVLNFGLYQKWDELELPEHAQLGYTAVQEIVENEIKSYKKFCKEQKQKIKNHWEKIKSADDTNVLPERNYQTETKTKADINNNKESTKKAEPEKKPTALEVAFEDFWKEFPKQRIGNKEKAKSAFEAAVKRSGMLAFQLVAKAREYAKSDEVARGFAKGAQAWLNDDRFLRSYTPGTGASTLEEARENGYRIIDNIFGGK